MDKVWLYSGIVALPLLVVMIVDLYRHGRESRTRAWLDRIVGWIADCLWWY